MKQKKKNTEKNIKENKRKENKTERVEIRLTSKQKKYLANKAKKDGKTLSQYILDNCCNSNQNNTSTSIISIMVEITNLLNDLEEYISLDETLKERWDNIWDTI